MGYHSVPQFLYNQVDTWVLPFSLFFFQLLWTVLIYIALFTDDPMNTDLIGSSTWYSNHQESLSSEYQNGGIFELETTPGSLQMESTNWIQTAMLDTPDQLHEGY